MSCPICNNTELHEGAESCSKCGSDLEIFTHIENAHKENNFNKKSILVLTALFGIILVSWGSASLFSGKQTEATVAVASADTTSVVVPAPVPNALTASSKPVEAFVNDNAEVKPDVAPLKPEAEAKVEVKVKTEMKTPTIKTPVVKNKKKVKVVEAPVTEDGVVIHKVKRGDSFWTISKKYFKNGKHAKQIAADNNLNVKKSIPLGTKLKINK